MPKKHDLHPGPVARVARVLADCEGDKDAALYALALQVEGGALGTSAGYFRQPPNDQAAQR